MEREISIFEAKNRLSELVRAVHAGESEIVVTVRGKPMAKLVPLEQTPKMTRTEAFAALREFGEKHPLILMKGETLKDIISEGRR